MSETLSDIAAKIESLMGLPAGAIQGEMLAASAASASTLLAALRADLPSADRDKIARALGVDLGRASPFVALRGQVVTTVTAPLAQSGDVQLLPAGSFSARDGRPGPGRQWHVSDSQGFKLAADINAIARQTPLVVDYEHQTLRSEGNGKPAPAAGWIKSVSWRPGEGLFSDVEWTLAAKASINAGEYRYISPVILSSDDGTVTALLMAALVNHPALLGMKAVEAALAGLRGDRAYPQRGVPPPGGCALVPHAVCPCTKCRGVSHPSTLRLSGTPRAAAEAV